MQAKQEIFGKKKTKNKVIKKPFPSWNPNEFPDD